MTISFTYMVKKKKNPSFLVFVGLISPPYTLALHVHVVSQDMEFGR